MDLLHEEEERGLLQVHGIQALSRNETGKNIKALRSDNGKGCVSNAFKDECAKEGVRREMTTPHNP